MVIDGYGILISDATHIIELYTIGCVSRSTLDFVRAVVVRFSGDWGMESTCDYLIFRGTVPLV